MCTILVIDDEKGILRVIEEALTKFGHKVELAADGYEGIQKFDDGTYDIVITDLRMPGLDGKGVVQHIRNSQKNSIPGQAQCTHCGRDHHFCQRDFQLRPQVNSSSATN